MPAISFVVITYNVEQYVSDCLHSLQSQTSGDYEVIVVDDASTDSTPDLVKSIVEGDDRFMFIAKKHNEGAHRARRTGVAQAAGRFVVFVDGDDELEPTACEVLVPLARKRDFDILRFGRSLVPHGDANMRNAFAEEHSFNDHTAVMRGADVIRSVFSEDFTRRNSWSLIDCLFDGDFVRSGFEAMTSERLGRLEDSYEFFVLASRARVMDFVTEYRALNYHFGAGISGFEQESLERFTRWQIGIHSTVDAVLEFAHADGSALLTQCAHWYRRVVLGIVGREWVTRLVQDDQVVSVELLRRTWGDESVAYMILDPLSARAQWFNDHQAIPSSGDPYRCWDAILHSLELKGVSDEVVKDRVERFYTLEHEITQRKYDHDLGEMRQLFLRELIDEMERKRIEEERERAAHELELEKERNRIFKKDSLARRILDTLLPEQSTARRRMRRIAEPMFRLLRGRRRQR